MDIYKIVVLRREDLRHNHKVLNLNQITLFDFDYTLEKEMITTSDFVIFVDSPKEYVVLKNRYQEDSPQTKAMLNYLGLV